MQARHLHETQAFFGARAAGWENRYPDDTPQFQRAIDEMGLRPGMTVLDVGCGSGRALPLVRAAVGPSGRVVGLDATPEMLAEAERLGRAAIAHLVLGDAECLPLVAEPLDAIFAAGMVPHLTRPLVGLSELARVTRPGGCLAIFHPIGRVALAARHGGTPSNDDVTAPTTLARLLSDTGWRLVSVDDAPDRFLALAFREEADN